MWRRKSELHKCILCPAEARTGAVGETCGSDTTDEKTKLVLKIMYDFNAHNTTTLKAHICFSLSFLQHSSILRKVIKANCTHLSSMESSGWIKSFFFRAFYTCSGWTFCWEQGEITTQTSFLWLIAHKLLVAQPVISSLMQCCNKMMSVWMHVSTLNTFLLGHIGEQPSVSVISQLPLAATFDHGHQNDYDTFWALHSLTDCFTFWMCVDYRISF